MLEAPQRAGEATQSGMGVVRSEMFTEVGWVNCSLTDKKLLLPGPTGAQCPGVWPGGIKQ